MKKSYKGFRKPYVICLSAKADSEMNSSIIETLQSSNIAVDYGRIPRKAEIERSLAVIAVLSEEFYKNEKLKRALLIAANAGIEIIPVFIDGAELPAVFAMLFYSVHSLRADRYENPEQLAERIVSSNALKNPRVSEKQKRQFKIVSVAAVLISIAIIASTVITMALNTAKRREVMLSYGITDEDLESIEYAIFAGDKLIRADSLNKGLFSYCFDIWDDDNKDIFYFADTGEAVPQGSITDLSIIKKMPDLKRLTIINQPLTKLPDLANLSDLEMLEIVNCNISDLSFLKGSSVRHLMLRGIPASDLSPVSDMKELIDFEIMAFEGNSVNFTAPYLDNFCVCNSKRLRDISSLSESRNLKRFYINSDDSLSDISAIAELDKLEEIYIGTSPIADIDALSNKPNIRTIELHDFYFKDVDFLKNLGTDSIEKLHLYSMNLSPESVDFSGLEALKHIDSLDFSCNSFDYKAVGEYVTETEIRDYNIGHTKNIDFSMLPKGIRSLGITGYSGTSLDSIPDNLPLDSIQICDSNSLVSLDGIEKINGLSSIGITECIRLQDFDALYDLASNLSSIEFHRGYVADLRRLNMADNCQIGIIDPIEPYDDLEALANLRNASGEPVVDIDRLLINGVSDIKGLYALADTDLHIKELYVDSTLYGAALEYSEKVRGKSDFETEVAFQKADNDSWNLSFFRLTSYEEIQDLPSVALKAVKEFRIIGDLYSDSYCLEWTEKCDDKGDLFYIRSAGPIDMSILTALENLESMELCNVRIENFEHIQSLQKLREIRLFQVQADNVGILDIMAGLEYKELQDIESIDQGAGEETFADS